MLDSYRDKEHFKEDNGYTIDGVWYPRVTRVVGIKSKPALLYYYAEAPDYRSAKASIEESAKEGTLVHEAAEEILVGKTPAALDPLIKPAIDAFASFLEENHIKTQPEFVERRILNKDHRYAGTIDALATINGRFGVLDIKTSQAIYRDYNLQTAAYMEALKSDFENLETRWILRIDQFANCLRCGATRRTKGGRTKIRRNGGTFTCSFQHHDWGPVQGRIELKEFPDWRSDFEAFLGAKRLWEWENEDWLKSIDYL